MKKIWFYPILGSSFLLGWCWSCNFVFNDGSYTGLGVMLLSIVVVLLVFPIWFARYAGKYTKFVLLPALYTSIVFVLPWGGMFVNVVKDGITYHDRTYIYIIIAVFVWNIICFTATRLFRYLNQTRKRKKSE